VEIIDFLKAARRRLALVILLPLVSMAATAGLLLAQAPQYTASAVVDPPALVGSLDSQYTGAQGVNQFVAAFEATSSGPVVRDLVSADTGVDAARLNDGLVVTQRLSSSSLSITYTDTKKAVIVPVLNGVATATLRTLFESQVQSAQGRVDAAKKAVDDASAAIGTFTAKYAMADPQKAYEAQLSRVNSLVQQQASLTAAGNSVGAAAMGSPIASAKADLAKFGPIITEYTRLTTARDTAVAGLDEANAKLSTASVQLANADPTKIVFIGGAHSVDRLPVVLTTTASVGAAAFFLSLVLVLVLEMVARNRRARELEQTDAEATAAASTTPAAASPTSAAAAPAAPSTNGSGHHGTVPTGGTNTGATKAGADNVSGPSVPRPATKG
jgi:capsular polysaccharide biosynthesis protein